MGTPSQLGTMTKLANLRLDDMMLSGTHKIVRSTHCFPLRFHICIQNKPL